MNTQLEFIDRDLETINKWMKLLMAENKFDDIYIDFKNDMRVILSSYTDKVSLLSLNESYRHKIARSRHSNETNNLLVDLKNDLIIVQRMLEQKRIIELERLKLIEISLLLQFAKAEAISAGDTEIGSELESLNPIDVVADNGFSLKKLLLQGTKGVYKISLDVLETTVRGYAQGISQGL